MSRTRKTSSKMLYNELYNLEATVLYGILSSGIVTAGQVTVHDRKEIAPYELDLVVYLSDDVRIGIEVQDLSTHTKYNDFKAAKCKAHGIIYCEVWENNINNDVKKVITAIKKAKKQANEIARLGKLNYQGEYNYKPGCNRNRSKSKSATRTRKKTTTKTTKRLNNKKK